MSMSFRQSLRAAVSGALALACLSSAAAPSADPNSVALAALSGQPDSISAIRLARGNGGIFCTLGDENQVVDNSRIAVLSSPEFRAWHDRGNVTKYAEVRTKVADLLYSMKNGRCSVAVENASNIIALAAELKREGMIFQVLPSAITPAQITELYARSLGFAGDKELLLAEHMGVNKQELLAYYKIGINSEATYDAAVARMRAQGYSDARADLMAFLKDEAEGEIRNLPATAIRDERNGR